MAVFETTPVVILRADPPTIVQRFLTTSRRFLLHPLPSYGLGIWQVDSRLFSPPILPSTSLATSPLLLLRGSRPAVQTRAAV